MCVRMKKCLTNSETARNVEHIMKKGKIIVISAPSGTGKTTICKELLKRIKNLKYSISTTTRPKRKDEIDGRDYFFVTEEEFKKLIKNHFFVEWQKVHNYYYGTSREFIEKTLNSGYNCLLDIDVKGGLKLKKEYPDGVFIFLAPPNWEELEKRLKKRGTESEKDLKVRLRNAKKEMRYKKHYNHIVINEKLDDTVNKIVEIIKNNV